MVYDDKPRTEEGRYSQERFDRLMSLKMDFLRQTHTNPGLKRSVGVLERQLREFPNYKERWDVYARNATRVG